MQWIEYFSVMSLLGMRLVRWSIMIKGRGIIPINLEEGAANNVQNCCTMFVCRYFTSWVFLGSSISPSNIGNRVRFIIAKVKRLKHLSVFKSNMGYEHLEFLYFFLLLILITQPTHLFNKCLPQHRVKLMTQFWIFWGDCSFSNGLSGHKLCNLMNIISQHQWFCCLLYKVMS